jgi:hypothetical protein
LKSCCGIVGDVVTSIAFTCTVFLVTAREFLCLVTQATEHLFSGIKTPMLGLYFFFIIEFAPVSNDSFPVLYYIFFSVLQNFRAKLQVMTVV